uniref:C-CAP/cofactor C-like domain-containing protein n=1 Tax=Gongylonema pulchrum TaxID=637853 RepID=A0A183D6B8_9BILA
LFQECCILLLDHTATVNADDCENCLIVLGPCKGSVFIRDCKNSTVFTVCQQFRSRDCVNIDVFLFCTTRPSIESSKQMRFRSLALSYEKLEGFKSLLSYSNRFHFNNATFTEHMLKASFSPFNNNWNKVYDFTPDESLPNFEICSTVSDLLRSAQEPLGVQ